MRQISSKVILSDSLHVMEKMQDSTIDMIYLDPPFFTNRHHSAVNRDRTQKFTFSDVWNGLSEYAEFMEDRLKQIHRLLKDTGSIFVHCDKNSNFLLRVLLNETFGEDQFRSEIIWTYRRWSNSAKGLMPAHQTIFFYSKTEQFKFNRIYCPYSETTNVDQILQLRARDEFGVSSYATNENGENVYGGIKKGVPLSDVWEIPFLNPKAKERTGYPTQKPVLLLERILEISTEPGDLVLDPFCGSGTTMVAAKILGRHSIGIDCSKEAVDLAQSRLVSLEKTESALMKKGRAAYINVDSEVLAILSGLDIVPVQRNAGIDAFLKISIENSPVPIRIQRQGENLFDAVNKLAKAAQSKNAKRAILVRTHEDNSMFPEIVFPEIIVLVDATAFQVNQTISKLIAKFGIGYTAAKETSLYHAASV